MSIKGQKFNGGTVPFGYEVSKRGVLRKNPYEQKIIRKVVSLRKKGDTFKTISNTLVEDFDGVFFTPDQIRKNVLRHASV